jgi:ketosteroid isomerase-like protein
MRWALFCAVLSLIICPVFGQDTENSAAEAAIRALEREWVQGQSRNDNRVLDLIFDNELVYVEYGRLVSKADYLSRIKQDVPLTDTVALEGMNVHVFGNTAIVVGSYQERQPHDHSRSLKRWRFIDTWTYKDRRGWTLVAAGSSPIRN